VTVTEPPALPGAERTRATAATGLYATAAGQMTAVGEQSRLRGTTGEKYLERRAVGKLVSTLQQEGPFRNRKRPLTCWFISGAGFEPATCLTKSGASRRREPR
jgi:hypothetical protein